MMYKRWLFGLAVALGPLIGSASAANAPKAPPTDRCGCFSWNANSTAQAKQAAEFRAYLRALNSRAASTTAATANTTAEAEADAEDTTNMATPSSPKGDSKSGSRRDRRDKSDKSKHNHNRKHHRGSETPAASDNET